MSRIELRSFLVLATVVSLAAVSGLPALGTIAAPAPIGGCALSATCPAWVELPVGGVFRGYPVSSLDVPITFIPGSVGGSLTASFHIPSAAFNPPVTLPWDPAFQLGPLTGGKYYGINRQDSAEQQNVLVSAAQGLLHATQFTFQASARPSGKATGGQPGVATASTNGVGTLTMFPHGPKDYSHGVSLAGTRRDGTPFGIPGFSTDIPITIDPSQKFVTVGFAVMQAIIASNGGGPAPQGPVWIPITDTNGDGKNDRISVNPGLVPGAAPGTLFDSDGLAPDADYDPNAGIVPALSGWGLVAMTISLSSAGLFLLRRTGFSIGI